MTTLLETPAESGQPSATRWRSAQRGTSVARNLLVHLVHLVGVILAVTALTFALLELVPGDPAILVLGPDAPAAQYEAVRAELRLDEPAIARYGEWLSDAARGDLGSSLRPPVQSVTTMIASRLPVTLELAGLALGFALMIAVPTALWCVRNPGGLVDRTASTISYVLMSTPNFLIALLLIALFVFQPDFARLGLVALLLAALVAGGWQTVARRRTDAARGRPQVAIWPPILVGLGLAASAFAVYAWWPSIPRQGLVRWSDATSKMDHFSTVFLPALALALAEVGVFFRVFRGDLLTTLQQDFILAARARGLSWSHILLREAVRPSLTSLVTVAGVSLGRLVGSAVIVESIFRLPGIGSMMVDAVIGKDLRVVQGGVLVIAVLYVVLNRLINMSYLLIDPRSRDE